METFEMSSNGNPSNPSTPSLFNLDHEAAYRTCAAKLGSPDVDNFVVRFNKDAAECAVDVKADEAPQWLDSNNRGAHQTVWLNFWASPSSSQRRTIGAIARKYGLSPRLAGLLSLATQTPKPLDSSTSTANIPATSDASEAETSATTPQTSKTKDLEKGSTRSTQPSGPLQPSQSTSSSSRGFGFHDVVDSLWHFCSVDFGRHYIYVGYNALFYLSGDENRHKDKPAGQRIWTSLLLCDDGTVISVFERPPIASPTAVKRLRSNVLNVFKHLSSLHDQDDAQDALMKVRVRWNEHSSKSQREYSETEAASLLFYYLFDDWVSTYKLIARKEHPYRSNLETLRRDMFNAADVSLIEQVHNTGRQLTVLKLMYQSYELIVSRLLHRQRAATGSELMSTSTPPAALDKQPTWGGVNEMSAAQMHQSELMYLDEDSSPSVRLSMSAVVRFERLLDRIRLYALTEIEECLKEKESLVFMNFNLVTLKESQAVERLTRTTILLAKATILFLPVSLMTAYFSIQLPEITEKYDLETYWLCFLVVSLLSIAFLAAFGFYTHTVEGKTIYKSVTSMTLDLFKRKNKAI
ncbi:hypothetical protein PV08_00511 [Exophiala spinifera]|uniref:ADP-ribosylation factor n=1 Tax=Exophiala spinifera TaxID=91928 RepID=A0A0D1YXD7_9EURO|nr:uncharacterized protein PV08_00511 [Exophiala spinifera]KIW19936.1 hypothetical protein PV08_00511 [Exophiala spinifera]